MRGVEAEERGIRPAIIVQKKSGNCRGLFYSFSLQILPMQKKNISLGHLLSNNPLSRRGEREYPLRNGTGSRGEKGWQR